MIVVRPAILLDAVQSGFADPDGRGSCRRSRSQSWRAANFSIRLRRCRRARSAIDRLAVVAQALGIGDGDQQQTQRGRRRITALDKTVANPSRVNPPELPRHSAQALCKQQALELRHRGFPPERQCPVVLAAARCPPSDLVTSPGTDGRSGPPVQPERAPTDLVTTARYDCPIPLYRQWVATVSHLVTRAPRGPHGRIRDAHNARPSRAPHAPDRRNRSGSRVYPASVAGCEPCSPHGRPWPSSSAGVHPPADRDQNTWHSSYTCVDPLAPSSPPRSIRAKRLR